MSTPTEVSEASASAPVTPPPTPKPRKPRRPNKPKVPKVSIKISAKSRGPHPDYTTLMTDNMNSNSEMSDSLGVAASSSASASATIEDPLDDSNRMLRPFELGLFPDTDEPNPGFRIPHLPSRIGAKMNRVIYDTSMTRDGTIEDDDGDDPIVIIQPHSETPFMCGICKNAYATQFKLDIHLRVHVNQKPFQCDRCNKGYRNKNCYDRHMKQVHAEGAEENPFKCDVCGKHFRLKYSLRAHKYKHSVGDKYKCDECGVCCYTATTLTAHKNKQHTGEKPFPCEHCHKSYFTKSELNRHFMTHTGERPYACEMCGRGFAYKQNLTAHVRKMHAGPMELQNMSNPLPFILPFLEGSENNSIDSHGGENVGLDLTGSQNSHGGENSDTMEIPKSESNENSDEGINEKEDIDIKPDVIVHAEEKYDFREENEIDIKNVKVEVSETTCEFDPSVQ